MKALLGESDSDSYVALRQNPENFLSMNLAIGKENIHFLLGEQANLVNHGFGCLPIVFSEQCPRSESSYSIPQTNRQPVDEWHEEVRLEEELPGGGLDPQSAPDTERLSCKGTLGLIVAHVLDDRVREDDVERVVVEGQTRAVARQCRDPVFWTLRRVVLSSFEVQNLDAPNSWLRGPVVGVAADVENSVFLRWSEFGHEGLESPSSEPRQNETVDGVDVHRIAFASVWLGPEDSSRQPPTHDFTY